MPSLLKVRRTGSDDCSTSRMISSFSEAGYQRRASHDQRDFGTSARRERRQRDRRGVVRKVALSGREIAALATFVSDP
jgi:DNA-binding MarR family transcriptional regulator